MPNYRYKVFKGQKVVAVSTTLREAEAEAQRIGGGVLAIKNPALAAPAKAKDLTKTAAFQRWFGDSKVVDKKGKPLVVYHGTEAQFTAFDKRYVRDQLGFHFGTKGQAKRAPSGKGKGSHVDAYWLSIQNPLRVRDEGSWTTEAAVEAINQAAGLRIRYGARDAEIVRALQAAGYDGIVYANRFEYGGDKDFGKDSWIVFEPTQIKSATSNIGTFDPQDPDIRNPAVAAPAKAKDLTKTAAFKRWFGDSKVVDKKGKPLVVYHGSPEYGFKVFDLEKIDAHHVGFFFTDKRDMANTYAEGKPEQRPKRSGIYEVYLRIEEPFEVDAKGAIWDNIPLEYEDWDGTVVEERASTITISRTARDLGHDGCIIHNVYDGWGDQRGDVFVAFNPNQVKSVDNRGTFSQYDDNIRNPVNFATTEPLYHGTYKEFDKLKLNDLRILWLTDEPEVALAYADRHYRPKDSRLMVWKVKLKPKTRIVDLHDLGNPIVREFADSVNEVRRSGWGAINDEEWAGYATFGMLEGYFWAVKFFKSKGVQGVIVSDRVDGMRRHYSLALLSLAAIESAEKTTPSDIRNPAERTFIPPPAVAAEARKALDLRAKQPPSNRCCTPVGIARAKQLANRQPVSETTLRRMKAFFDRHAVDAKGKGWGVDSKGWQAWLAWGGTSGRKWCENILRSL